MIVRELLTRLSFATNEGQLNKYERGVQNIKRSADGAAESFRNMFAGFIGFAAIRSLARTADDVQNMEARISLLPQTVGSAADAFEMVSARASAARQPLADYAELYTRIGHAAKAYVTTQEAVAGITDTVSKGLIVGGASAQESISVMRQLSQALGSGTLQGEEFRAMAEGAPQMLDALAEAMGHPRDQLKKLASESKITTKDMILGFQKISADMERRFLAMPMTISQSTTIIANRFQTFIAKLNRESQIVTKVADTFLKTFTKIEVGLKEMVKFFGGATNTLKFFGIALAAVLAPLAFKLFAGALAFIVSPLGLILAGLLLLGIAIEDVYQWMSGGGSIIGRWLGDFRGFAKYFEGGFLGAVKATINSIKTYFMVTFPFGEFISNLKGIMNGMIQLFTGAFNVIAGLFKILFGFLSGDFDLLWEGIKQTFSGVYDIVVGVFNTLKNAFSNITLIIKQIFTAAFTAIGSIILNSILGGIVAGVKGGWQAAKNLMSFGTISPTVAAGAASAPGGVPVGGGAGGTQNITVNQTLPPGTPAETAAAAENATRQAMSESEMFSRQAAQAY